MSEGTALPVALAATSLEPLIRLAEAGCGIASIASFAVDGLISQGRLVEVLPNRVVASLKRASPSVSANPSGGAEPQDWPTALSGSPTKPETIAAGVMMAMRFLRSMSRSL